MLDELNEMNKKLESIQKSLEAYLETKRGVFPRFYFISNDDLLEILGQSKTPNSVQPHLKKLFDNISFLDMKKEAIYQFVIYDNKQHYYCIDRKEWMYKFMTQISITCITKP